MTAHGAVRIDLPMERITALCRRWRIVKLSLFGSVLRDDFRPDSDIDVLVTFAPGTYWPWGGLSDIADELEGIFGRRVEVTTHRAVEEDENPYRRNHILASAETVYAA